MPRQGATKTARGPDHPRLTAFDRSRASYATTAPMAWSRGRRPLRPVGGRSKRVLDIFVATLTLLVAAPLMAMVALLVTCCDGGPALFSQTRVGFDGRTFRCWKFRTMVVDAQDRLAAHLAEDADAALEWERTRKLARDPRVTRSGRFLRRASLDELPQLFNVLLGDMSCVGPRPVTAPELTKYGRAAPAYLSARPGLTGLWQVAGRSRLSYEERVALDADYVARCSLRLDLTILLRTIPALMDFDAAS